MPSNKNRLYVALYARGGPSQMAGAEDTYHWALLVTPKKEGPTHQGKRLHAKEVLVGGQQQWEYSNQETGTLASAMILARVRVAKVEDTEQLEKTLQHVPMQPDVPGWNCVSWVRDALEALSRDGASLGTAMIDWDTVRAKAMWYVGKKAKEHRYDGKAPEGTFDYTLVPTFCLLTNGETCT